MEVYATGCRVKTKAELSPVSEADERAEAIILAGLNAARPAFRCWPRKRWRAASPAVDGRFILVDPLDGTREFLSRNGEFTVNIALVEGGRPVGGRRLRARARPSLGRGRASIAGVDVDPGDGCADGRSGAPIHTRRGAGRRLSWRSRAGRIATPRPRLSWRGCRSRERRGPARR